MKVQEIMERSGIRETGRAISYIEDALEEMNLISETHVKKANINIKKDKRFYQIPLEAVKITDIRVKNHLNSKDEYRSIPRLIHKPRITDADNT